MRSWHFRRPSRLTLQMPSDTSTPRTIGSLELKTPLGTMLRMQGKTASRRAASFSPSLHCRSPQHSAQGHMLCRHTFRRQVTAAQRTGSHSVPPSKHRLVDRRS